MGPRKRSKPNPKAETEGQSESQKADVPKCGSFTPSSEPSVSSDKPTGIGDPKPVNDRLTTTPQSSKSWYGGTWPRGNKATPVTQVAKESISAAGGAASEIVASARSHTLKPSTTPIKSPAVYLSRNIASSSRSLPLAATITKLNITSNAPDPANGAAKERHISNSKIDPEDQKASGDSTASSVGEKTEGLASDTSNFAKRGSEAVQRDVPSDVIRSNRDSVGWLNWFSRGEGPQDSKSVTSKQSVSSERTDNKDQERHRNITTEASKDAHPLPVQRRSSDPSPVSPKIQQEPPPRTWLGFWGNTITQPQNSASTNANGMATIGADHLAEAASKVGHSNTVQDQSIAVPQPSPQPAEIPKSYGWAFWSKDESKDDQGKKKSAGNIDELAQANSLSQSKLQDAVLDSKGGVPEKVGQRERPHPLVTLEDFQKTKSAEDSRRKDTRSSMVNTKSNSAAESSLKAKRMPENLLLPSFKRTYSHVGRPTFVQQLSRYLQLAQPSELKHVSIVQNPHRVKRALAIGVHGYFPAPLIRSVLGQPTGTSIRFANSTASAIQRWTQNQGYSCEIEKVALEGEGRIAERIDLLWKLMLNWIEKIQRADFVMIACHSQGVPVVMMLVAKLIAFGCVNSAKIGVCAMAGVNLGPFADYKSRWISGSAGELFEFARPESQVSRDYEAALDVALKFGVKVVYIGSIDDQLVSLHSSTFGTVSHPYIYRAVFVDGRVHAPDFLTHLVGFALKLRNLGISDHGLIRELSTPLAGSLYGGEGHSRIYDDEAVYYLAVEHALETSSLGSIPLQTHHENPATAQNPYILPFAMRGLLEEDYVRAELYGEITELIKQFDDWKPTSKVLKDVKFRLEGVRSKL